MLLSWRLRSRSKTLASTLSQPLSRLRAYFTDAGPATIAATLAGAIGMLANMAFFMGGGERRNNPMGFVGMLLVMLRAYSLGAGTYTGIEAVSNNVNVLAEPRTNPEAKMYPGFASIVAKHRGANVPGMPPAVHLNVRDRTHFAWAGYLGQKYNPFVGDNI